MKRHFSRLTTLLLFLALIFSFPIVPTGAVGYEAQTARKNFSSGEEITNILDYENGDAVDGILFGIYDAAGLVRFSELVNDSTPFRGENVRVCLCASIDMGQVAAFTPIGNGMRTFDKTFPSGAFKGLFDGRGYVIDNLTTASCSNDSNEIVYVSLFGCVANGARIRNLVIGSGCRFSYDGNHQNSCVAPLAARVAEGAEIQNILNLAPVSGGAFCGGIIARADRIKGQTSKVTTSLLGSTNNGSVNGKIAGGLVGNVEGNLTVQNCKVRGTVTGGKHAGKAIGAVSQCTIDSSTASEVSLELNGVTAKCALTGGSSDPLIGKADGVSPTETDCSVSDIGQSEIGVRFHGVQLAEADGRVSIRFIASIDRETLYTEAGFSISVNNSDKVNFLSCTKLFSSLLGMVDGETVVYTAETLRGDDGYLFAATIAGITIPNDEWVTFTVAPYATGYRSEPTYTLTLRLTKGVYTVTWKD